MNTIIQPQIIVPIFLLLLQAGILLFVTISILRSLGILKTPYAGIDYSYAITAAAYIGGAIFISTAQISALFQSYKVFHNQGVDIISNIFHKFSQFFLVIVFFEIIYFLVFLFSSKVFTGTKKLKDVLEANIPLSALIAVSTIGFSVICWSIACELINSMIPDFITIR